MSETRKKITVVFEWIIGVALAICLFVGGLGFLGFIYALIVGGETAAAICTWLSGVFYVNLIKLSTITTLACMLLQYVNGNAKWRNPFRGKSKAE